MPKHRHRSVPAVVTAALASFGLFVWFAISSPGRVGLPAGLAVLATGFLLLLKLVNRIVFRKFPESEDF
jgi:hypothetical protein